VPLEERVQRWLEDERGWRQSPHAVIEAIAALEPAPNVQLLTIWKDLAKRGLATSVLADYFDQRHAVRVAQRLIMSNAIAPLIADSLDPARLALAVRDWQQISDVLR
jgi:hypothetical protein